MTQVVTTGGSSVKRPMSGVRSCQVGGGWKDPFRIYEGKYDERPPAALRKGLGVLSGSGTEGQRGPSQIYGGRCGERPLGAPRGVRGFLSGVEVIRA